MYRGLGSWVVAVDVWYGRPSGTSDTVDGRERRYCSLRLQRGSIGEASASSSGTTSSRKWTVGAGGC